MQSNTLSYAAFVASHRVCEVIWLKEKTLKRRSQSHPRLCLVAYTMISGFLVYNQKGEVLISRTFKPDVRYVYAEAARAARWPLDVKA
jgi:hypothetical protein